MAGPARDAARLLAAPGQVIEVRALADRFTHSGYFDDYDALARSVEPLDADASVHGIYVTLNAADPALLSRRANRIKLRLAKSDSTTGDADIVRRRWFPVDIDPKRPSGVSSTDAEHGLALARADEIADWLAGLGFPEPVRADSGNGAHLLYRIDLPNSDDATALVKAGLAALDALFSDNRVLADTANYNAARIWKLYGTVSRKGDSTPDRPHRRSRILSAPDSPEIVGRDLLERLAARLPAEEHAEPPPAGSGKPFDLRRWLGSHGIGVRSEKPFGGGTLFVLEACPFSSAHADGSFAIQFGNGALFAGCKHTSCGGGVQRWKELRGRYEPDRTAVIKSREERLRSLKKDRAMARAGADDPPPTVPPPAEYPDAIDVLEHGDPVALMLETFAEDHVGDEIVARCMILSMASQAVKNSDGLHVSVTGDSGKGKTHAFKKMLRQVPDPYKIRGTVSNKALYYMKDLRARTVLMSDDTELSDSLQEILKSATSNFHEPITHTTVTKDLASRVCTIPERCVWWIAKKEGTGDDQVMNRMLTCWIDESAGQDERVLAAKQAKEAKDPDTLSEESEKLVLCRKIWEILHRQLFWVIIPYSRRIRFQRISNRRNPDMLYDLIKSHAALHFLQRRQKTSGDGTLCIYADESDFSAAAGIYSQLNGTSGGQESKLTRKEAALLATIEKADLQEFTIHDLQRLTGEAYHSIYRMIKGYDSRGRNYTGLLEKCPAISFTDRTVTVSEESGYSVRRRTEAFEWDRDLYRQWMNGGACWLERDRGDDDDTGSDAGTGSNGFQQLQQVCSNFTAPAANESGEPGGPGSCSGTSCTKNIVQENHRLQQNRNYGEPEKPDLCKSLCTHNPQPAANEKRSPPGTAGSAGIGADRAPAVYSSRTNDAATVQQTGPVAENKGPPRSIRATDYKKLDIPEPAAICYACGKPGSRYVEKYTPERRARPKDSQQARRICRACYDAAVKAEREAAEMLPGTLDLPRFSRVTADVGKCSLCGIGRAEWIDREAGVKLCGECWGKAGRRGDGI